MSSFSDFDQRKFSNRLRTSDLNRKFLFFFILKLRMVLFGAYLPDPMSSLKGIIFINKRYLNINSSLSNLQIFMNLQKNKKFHSPMNRYQTLFY